MTNIILTAVMVLGAIGVIFAIVLYFVTQKFKVVEDPKIDEVLEVLPGANCGGCGKAGCRAMAEAFVKQGNMEGLACPAGGPAVAEKVAEILGCTPEVSEPKVAVVRCNGSCENAPAKNNYDGLKDCAFANSVYGGETGCQFGCLGFGNCASVCQFGALSMDPVTGLPIVDEEKCTACGACVKACPRGIIELRNKGKKNRRVYIACRNKEKGGIARKSCSVSCGGCGLCAKTCKFDAITIENNLAYIDFNKCIACGQCVNVCANKAIHAANFTPVVPKKPAPAETPAAPAAPAQPTTNDNPNK